VRRGTGTTAGGKTRGESNAGAAAALAGYRKKRDFRRTPEPAGDDAAAAVRSRGLAYVVQKHAASRLHYDFRLELDGVLKSWAVPKGPSLDPADKRLAVHVEDHPLDYGDFEGTIPQHQYGGGTVLLWDRGTWEPEDGEAAARTGLGKGKLHFRLEGDKLTGGWILVRMHGPAADGGKNWLLIKEDDDAARPGEGEALVEERTESVASGREMEEIAADPDRVWHAKGAGTPASARLDPSAVEGARKGKLPGEPRPMLATLVDEAPAGDGWLHEIKHDGYRLLCRVERRAGRAPDVRLLTRTGKDWTARFEDVAAAAGELPVRSALLDGEVVALAPDGTSSFARLQQALGKAGGGRLACYLFDLLHLDGVDLRRAPLVERKRLLAELLDAAGADGEGLLRFSDHVAGHGDDFVRQACRHAVEGVVSKRAASTYSEGRSRDWRKVKCGDRQELVVGGFTEPSGSRAGFGSLLLGVYPPADGDVPAAKLVYTGRVGTGFDDATLEDLRERLGELEVRESPFVDPRRAAGGRGAKARGVHWVRPELVAEVSFTEWTEDGVLRHPSFRGLREDKAAEDVVREPAEMAGDDDGDAAGGGTAGGRSAEERKEARMAEKVSREAARAESGGERSKRGGEGRPTEVAGVRLTSPDRVVYPDQGVTKRDLALYYESVADRILPHLEGRPLSLVRCPKGREGQCFYQKHVDEHFPDAVVRTEVPERDGPEIYGMVDSVAGLVAMVQMGVLELHTWGARRDRIERPDRLVFDLDPDEGLAWTRVAEAAVEVRDRLAALGLESFAKTTGGKGLHVVVPIERRIGWDDLKDFARGVAESMVRDAPGRYTDNMSKAKRKGKVFIDYLRNGRGATFIAAYSTRARRGATVSAPVRWDELGRVRPDGYDVRSLPRRLASQKADPWEGFDAIRQSVTAKMRKAVGRG